MLNKQLGDGMISNIFKENGINTFDSACEWVRALPYRRNTTKEDKLIVLKESCGTCSSKHELIKRLAEENDIKECKLVLCIFKMSAINTPKIRAVLEDYDLDFFPEAHIYVTINGVVNDLTFPENPELLYLNDVLFTEEISADQILTYKVEKHQAFMKEWIGENRVLYSFEELWGIRERCIEVLSL